MKVELEVQHELFRFTSWNQWVDKAKIWFATARAEGRLEGDEFLCVDRRGRVASCGKHFRRAKEDGAYPIVVYVLNPTRAAALEIEIT